MARSNTSENVQVSMVICEAEEKRHRSGVNALQIDPDSHRLYSAGRDSIIRVYEGERYQGGMQHHTDWVNDIILCCNGRYLISVSSDFALNVWDPNSCVCRASLTTHTDYVKALAYAKDREQVASAGLDKCIYLWDVNKLTALTRSHNTIEVNLTKATNRSIYSLAMNPAGTVIVSGSSDKVVRVWDPRNFAKLFKLRGHSEMVKAVVVSEDGTYCVSGSCDGSIKVWSLGSRRCIQTIKVHSDSVWALLATDRFRHVISGGRDKKVIMTDIKNPNNSPKQVCIEEAPVLKMCFSADQQAVWVSTVASSIRCWKLPKDELEMSTTPIYLIQGGAAICQASVLNDKRHILTKDASDNVALFDVLRAQKVEELGQVNFQGEVENRFINISVPNWFNVDLKTGMLTIHLEQNCFSAWVSARDAEIKDCPEPDKKVNYGTLLLQALFEHWRGVEKDPQNKLYFTVPKHIPLFISETGGRTLYRSVVGQTSDNCDDYWLNKTVPNWVVSNIKDNL